MHATTNQVPELVDYNLFTTDTALVEGVRREQAGWHEQHLSYLGLEFGGEEIFRLGEQANKHTPELITYDRLGRRIDVVEFHQSWHTLLHLARHEGLHASAWSQPKAGAHVARAASYFLQYQIEAGTLCPITMTFAAIPLLQNEPQLFATLKDKLFAAEHDKRDLPIEKKRAIMIGMGMTEKQGGSDVRSNTTSARALSDKTGRGAEYLLTGHKWFFSAPMCDAHLVLAKTEGGLSSDLSCFFAPRWRPDDSKNSILIQRLKDKLGNRSNASSEVEFDQAWSVMVGEEGRGIQTLIEMASITRFDCVIGSAALMRQALVQALHHTRHRHAFGKRLADQPLMRNVLADLALESEAATVLMLRLASAFDAAQHDPANALEQAWRRIVTPAAKFWICKRALEFTGECMEIWGGNGYVETGPLARLYREAPVNSIWEGSGNIMCLDVLRAIDRDPEGFERLMKELQEPANAEPELQKLVTALRSDLKQPAEQREALARRITQQLVLALQGSLMLQHAPLSPRRSLHRQPHRCRWRTRIRHTEQRTT